MPPIFLTAKANPIQLYQRVYCGNVIKCCLFFTIAFNDTNILQKMIFLTQSKAAVLIN